MMVVTVEWRCGDGDDNDVDDDGVVWAVAAGQASRLEAGWVGIVVASGGRKNSPGKGFRGGRPGKGGRSGRREGWRIFWREEGFI
ncbi:hypothetical protein Tco_0417383 [Tanacetum coccineum]